MNKLKLGTTYSQREIEWLGFDHTKSFQTLLKLNFDVIRLCCYWSEIEIIQGNFDYSKIIWMLDECERVGQKVALTIGVKAPRWPEYYFPEWLKDKDTNNLIRYIKTFIENTINKLKNYKCLEYWHVENEPLDTSGPENLNIPWSILEQEIEIVKKCDNAHRIIINLWGNNLSERGLYKSFAGSNLIDVVGLDLYYKVPWKIFYGGPHDSKSKLNKIIREINKEVWITELQAEAWESNNYKKYTLNPKSMKSANEIYKNFERVKNLNVSTVLFWGFEYWIWKKEKLSDLSYLNTIKDIINNNKL